ncbi:MAG: GlsB/YeaQ/YmgE family stress response membrane protein [Rhodomicrobium sp.]
MDPIGIIGMLLVGAIAGWLAGVAFSGHGFGYIGNIALGILGAIVAGFLLPGFLPLEGIAGQIVSAAIGAIFLLFLISLVKRR